MNRGRLSSTARTKAKPLFSLTFVMVPTMRAMTPLILHQQPFQDLAVGPVDSAQVELRVLLDCTARRDPAPVVALSYSCPPVFGHVLIPMITFMYAPSVNTAAVV